MKEQEYTNLPPSMPTQEMAQGLNPNYQPYSPEEQAKHELTKLIAHNRARVNEIQVLIGEAIHLQALLDSLPTKLSFEAARGLKALVRHYPLR